jgi:TDG/mug DNA glycosylase family protein
MRIGIDSSAMDGPHHRVVEEWMGQQVETLEDLMRPGLRAVCVGINPAPRSVRAGHYYQGKLGQKFFSRLSEARVVPPGRGGWQDDEAFAAGVGFTDIVKRPTDKASQVRSDEYEHGRRLLEAKLEQDRPGLVIFTFKETAKRLFGSFSGNGFVSGLQLAHSEVFVMPGPYESAGTASETLDKLAAYR